MNKIMKIIIIDMILLAAIAGFFVAVYLPQNRRLEACIKEINQISKQSETLSYLTAGIIDVEGDIVKADLMLKKYEEMFRPQSQMPHLMQSVSGMLNDHQLKVLSILPKEEHEILIQNQVYIKHPIEIKLEGQYEDLSDLLFNIEQHPNAITVEELEINRLSDSKSRVQIYVVIAIYLTKV
ncbi:MAG: type 4a pilus biogenesis protein PilO [Chlamydiota bacterium]|nr:type 4a pilus biogenesis protein PilO [Chlamydiota bacterium]